MKDQKGFSAVEGIIILLLVGLLATVGWLVWSRHNASKSTASNSAQNSTSNQPKSVTVSELGVKIADPENRGLKIYYDDSAKIYIYDNTTYDTTTNTSSSTAAYAKYFKCDSDLTIYESDPAYDNAKQTDLTALVKVNGKSISLWAHGSGMDSKCDATTANATDAYLKDLVQYVKNNISAL